MHRDISSPTRSAMSRKRKSNTTTWLIIAGVVVAALWWAKNQIALITVGSVSIPFQKLDGTTVVLGIKLPIINPSAIPIRITGFAGAILSPEGAVISTVYLTRPATIPRFQQTELDFTSYIRATDALSELYNILTKGGAVNWKGYKIKGQMLVYGVPVPVESAIL